MLIIVNKNTNKVLNNMGTNSMFPNGDLPDISLKENEKAVRINDNHPIAQQIMTLKEYDLEIDGELITGVIPIETIEEYKQKDEFKQRERQFKLEVADSEMVQLIELLIEKGVILESDLKNKLKNCYDNKKQIELGV